MASPVCPLPVARSLIRTPSYDRRGTLICTPGYHRESGIFYAPPPGFELPPIPARPSMEDVRQAFEMWWDLVCDFPFADDASKAHILALPLTVLAREMIDGPVPMCLVNKPETGTGASLLLKAIGWVLLGEKLPESTWSQNEEEQRKYLTTLLMRGRPLVNLDNIIYLHSKDLLQVLSGDVREDRRLGGNELLSIPNRAAFVASGNNVQYDAEHAGRVYLVQLDAKVENPRLRDITFKHPDLMAWAREQRPQIVAALLTLIHSWLAAGRPSYKGKRLATFEAWSNVVGGILEHAGVEGFLSNRDRVMNIAQRSSDEDTEFLTEWFRVRETPNSTLVEPQKTTTIFKALVPFVPKPKNGRDATEVSLGVYLAKVVDKVRVLDDGTTVAIRRGAPDKHANAQRWVLEVIIRGKGLPPKDQGRGANGAKPWMAVEHPDDPGPAVADSPF